MRLTFPTTKTQYEFIQEQIAFYQERISKAKEERGFLYQFHGTTELGDSCSIGTNDLSDDQMHVYLDTYQCTGRAAMDGLSMIERMGAMKQMTEYCSALTVEINKRGGWTPWH